MKDNTNSFFNVNDCYGTRNKIGPEVLTEVTVKTTVFQVARWVQKFRRNILPPSSGLKICLTTLIGDYQISQYRVS
jgi:hypothetical protein